VEVSIVVSVAVVNEDIDADGVSVEFVKVMETCVRVELSIGNTVSAFAILTLEMTPANATSRIR
jgi:hypothetical protein